jgi:TetR/AcrR family transcriptional regulator, transcriptional repressor for nem operon
MARLDGAVPTADRILDVAERLMQTRGYNGFSYADVSSALRIEKASVHYHFPTKAELGVRMIVRYRERFGEALARIEREAPGAPVRLRRYAELWIGVLKDGGRMCLCGMLAAEVETLPHRVREELKGFFDANEAWLSTTLADGRKARVLRFEGSPLAEARALLTGLEGAMLLARSHGEPGRFQAVAACLLKRVGV